MVFAEVRRTLAAFALAFLALAACTEPSLAKVKFSAIAVDARTGDVIFSKDPDGVRHPASLTKVMTLYILFEELKAKRLTLDSRLRVSKYAASREPTKLGLKPGETIRVDDAIRSLVTLSANDMAVAIAENIEGSEAAFAKRMTATAKDLGMSRSKFYNASGLPDPRQVTTARDMATLSLRIQRDFPQYYPYFRITSFKYGKRVIRSHNRLLGRYAGTDGIKTGYIRAAGFNLTSSVKRGDKRLIGVVLGARSGGARNSYMMAMLDRAWAKCRAGKTLAASIEGVSAPKLAVVEEPEASPPPAVEKPAKAIKPSAGKDKSGPEFTAPAQQAAMNNLAEDASEPLQQPAEGTTYATVQVQESDSAPVATGEIVEPGTTLAMNEPPANLPFKVKSANDTKGGVVIVPTKDANSTWNIQLGAYPNKEEAQAALYKAKSVSSKLFSGKLAFTVEVRTGDDTTLYRARMSGFNKSSARSACKTLVNKGMSCETLSPQS
ncbi:MAG: serine hydrolase [Parvibaculaceae bacterium]|jgi:D-alanyl-D-alanine carboxypeptidase